MKLTASTNENSILRLMVGFQDGSLRLLRPGADLAWQLIYAAKPHAGMSLSYLQPVWGHFSKIEMI